MKEGRSFWKWLVLWCRAGAMEKAREIRINKEIIDAWVNMRHESAEYGDYCDDREDNPSADESSTVGFFGSDCGDGGTV